MLVRAAAGRVQGSSEDGLTVFRGIPFAAPPVGDARLAAPRPVTPWDGILDAVAFGPEPPQEPLPLPGMPQVVKPSGPQWLTVNVWTPGADPAARRPVLVWIYGGVYKMGSSAQAGYNGRHLADGGDLVVVTFNYRVGVEGFAVFDGAPANRGLLDQVAALQWVRENIAAFGGDPDQVTIFGESSGAGSVTALLAMPSAVGLFRRAIAQSVPSTFLSRELGAAIGAAIAAELGLRPHATDLATVAEEDLVAAGVAVGAKQSSYAEWGAFAHHGALFAPVVDGEVLTRTPWDALSAGAARGVDLIVGHNRDESRVFLAMDQRLGNLGEQDAAHWISVFGEGRDYRAAYPSATAEQIVELVYSDWLFRMPTYRLAEAQAAGGGRAFLYELTWSVPIFGACHGLDVPLVFGTLDEGLGGLLLARASRDEAVQVSAAMRQAWTAFARTGDPGWPAFDPSSRATRVFDVAGGIRPYPEETSRQLWGGYSIPVMPGPR